ncbi:hypothetical protein BJ165DRAFT_1610049 [Panaeolus papilionaceus]|nr:hypothetical protein BJ165DRAFT_1610049 [Panaeolus papilionaceus]
MMKITLDHIATMGQTGEGIQHETELDMTQNNSLTNAWTSIRETCPWFFTMKEFIADRPNKRPKGIGNSQSDVDLDVFDQQRVLSGSDDGEGEEHGLRWEAEQTGEKDDDDLAEIDEEVDAEEESNGGDLAFLTTSSVASTTTTPATGDNDDNLPTQVSLPPTQLLEIKAAEEKKKSATKATATKNAKRKVTEEEKNSQPDVKPKVEEVRSAKKAKNNNFNTLLQTEEITRQKELNLQRIKLESATKIKLATSNAAKAAIDAKVELERQRGEERRAKIEAQKELWMEEMRLKHQLEMA